MHFRFSKAIEPAARVVDEKLVRVRVSGGFRAGQVLAVDLVIHPQRTSRLS
jgi:hypothetical protein